jgi:manganese transport protein
MGRFANGRLTQVAAVVGAAIVLLLNAFLILQIAGVPLPGFGAAG